MTELEFEVMDELYFVSSFAELSEATGLPDAQLVKALKSLASQGFVKLLFPDPDTELAYQPGAFDNHLGQLYFLATKAGLLAHNTR